MGSIRTQCFFVQAFFFISNISIFLGGISTYHNTGLKQTIWNGMMDR